MLLKLSKFFTYASLFCVLVVLTGAFFPFIGGKTYFFRIAVELAVAIAFLWWAFEAPTGEAEQTFRDIFRKPLVVAVSVFVLVFLLASLFADNSHGAFWSNYERGAGGFQMLHYYAFFLLLTFFFKDGRDWERLFKVAVAAAFLMVLYGIGSAVLTGHCPPNTQLAHSRISSSALPVCAGATTASGTPQYAPSYSNPFGLVSAYIGPQGSVAPTFLGRLFSPSVRFQGSLGNPAYVAPYLLFVMFYCFYLFSKRTKSWWWFGAGMFFFLFLVLTQTRGSFIGFLFGAFVFLFYVLMRSEGVRRFRVRIALWGFVLVNWLLAFHVLKISPEDTSPWGFAKRLYDVGFNPGQLKYFLVASVVLFVLIDIILTAKQKVQRIAAMLILAGALAGGSVYIKTHGDFFRMKGAESFATRVWTWGSAWQGFKERPLLGWGPENFPAVFDKYFDPRHFIPGKATETWFDRAHSVVFDYLAETGILGILAYVAIFATFFWQCVKRFSRSAEFVMAQGLIVALAAGYLVQAFVLFDVLPIYINLFLFLAFAAWRFDEAHHDGTHPHHENYHS